MIKTEVQWLQRNDLTRLDLAASAAVFCTQPHVILLKYGEI